MSGLEIAIPAAIGAVGSAAGAIGSAAAAAASALAGSMSGVIGQLAFGLVSTLISGLLGPKSKDVSITAGQELQISGSSEGPIVPIIWGIGYVLPNLVRYEKGSVRNVKITEKVKGGLFSSSKKITVGRRDFASWEAAICLGPIDVIYEIVVMPSQENALSVPIRFEDHQEKVSVYISSGPVKGNLDIYRGTMTQTRGVDYYSTKHGTGSDSDRPALNYRGVAFAVFKDFECGSTSPTGPGVPIPTFKFKIQRIPTFTSLPAGMERRGSYDLESTAYNDCNPAALLWEALTDEGIGPVVPTSILDVPSFVRASQIFAEYNQGLSLVHTSQGTVKDMLGVLKNNSRLLSFWDGFKLIVRCYYDNAAFYDNIRSFDAEDLSSVEIQLGTLDDTINEVKVRFKDLSAGSKEAIISRSNTANITDRGGRRMLVEVDGRALTTVESANRLAEITLQEGSYPNMSFTLQGGMQLATVEPMDVIALKWSIGDSQNVYYIRVAEVTPNRSAQTVKVTGIKDPLLNPEAGDEVATSAPQPSWFSVEDFDEEDRRPTEPADFGILHFREVSALELPPQFTRGLIAATVPIYQARQPGITGAKVFTQVGTGVASIVGDHYFPAISGTWTDGIEADTLAILEDSQSVELNEEELDGAAILAGGQIITSVEDDYTDLIDAKTSILVSKDEIMAVGMVEESEGEYSLKFIFRGLYGTKQRQHLPGETWFWFPDLEAFETALELEEDPGETVKVLSYAARNNELAVVAQEAYHRHAVNDQIYIAEGVLPLDPLFKSITDNGADNYTLELVPVLASQGAGISEEPVTDLDGLDFMAVQLTEAGAFISEAVLIGTFKPADHDDPEGGIFTGSLTVDGTAATLKIYGLKDGRRSNEALQIDL